MPWRRSQCSLVCPSSLDSGNNRCGADAGAIRPVSRAHRLATIGQHNVAATVPALSLVVGPAAVLWAIWTVVVDAVDGVSLRWAPAHVGQEISEIHPSIAHRDTASTISVEIGGCAAGAATDHTLPYGVFVGDAANPGFAVSFGSGSCQLIRKASATTDAALHQVVRPDSGHGAALALAQPVDTISRLVQHLRHESAECHAGKIDHVSQPHFWTASTCASMMRLTSSAIEMPSRFASRFKKALCGSVNEIICLVKQQVYSSLGSRGSRKDDKRDSAIAFDVRVAVHTPVHRGSDALYFHESTFTWVQQSQGKKSIAAEYFKGHAVIRQLKQLSPRFMPVRALSGGLKSQFGKYLSAGWRRFNGGDHAPMIPQGIQPQTV